MMVLTTDQIRRAVATVPVEGHSAVARFVEALVTVVATRLKTDAATPSVSKPEFEALVSGQLAEDRPYVERFAGALLVQLTPGAGVPEGWVPTTESMGLGLVVVAPTGGWPTGEELRETAVRITEAMAVGNWIEGIVDGITKALPALMMLGVVA